MTDPQFPDQRPYRRVVLKFSGEALMGPEQFGISAAVVNRLAADIQSVVEAGTQVALVVGGGNIWRGLNASSKGMDRATADYMGMLATVLNALALQDAIERIGIDTRVQTAVEMHQIAEPYIRRRSIRHLEKDRVVILAGGTGNPFFTTDTAAALRAAELGAEAVLMAKNGVDGVYSKDPNEYAGAKRFDFLTYQEYIEKNLEIIDVAAITLCRENSIPIRVFDVDQDGNILRAVHQKNVGTVIAESNP